MKRVAIYIVASVLLIALFGSLVGLMMSGRTKSIVITGSTIIMPIAQRCADAYNSSKGKNVNFVVNGGGSSVGIEALIYNKTDIANASRDIKGDELNRARDRGVNPVESEVAKDGLAIILNKAIDIREMDIETLRSIYKGEIRNWKELGGPNKKIIVVSRYSASGTYETFENRVMHGQELGVEPILCSSNRAVVDSVATIPYSIGYVGIGYVNDKINVLTVEGVYPSKRTVNDGTYLISRSLYMYTDEEPKGEIKRFIEFIRSEEGQKIVEQAGYVPLN